MWPFRQHFQRSSTVVQNPNINRMRFSHFMKQTSMVINEEGATKPLKRSLTVQSCLFLRRCFWHKHYPSFQLHTDDFVSLRHSRSSYMLRMTFVFCFHFKKYEDQCNLERSFNLQCFQHLCRNLISAHSFCKSVGMHL